MPPSDGPPESGIEEIARIAGELADYSDTDDEPTANVHVHLPPPSMPDSDPPAKAQRQLTTAVWSLLATVVAGAAAWVAAWLKSHKF